MTPEFAETFSLPKAGRGVGDFALGCLYAAFDRGGGFGEFFLVFDEQVWQKRIIDRFEELGATQISLITFDKKCKKTAFSRVVELGAKTGITVVRGSVPDELRYIVASQSTKQSDPEFDEKTRAMIKASLDGVDAKVDHVQESVTKVNDGVSVVIDHQRRMTFLEDQAKFLLSENKRINLLRDQLEYKVGKDSEWRNKYEALKVQFDEQIRAKDLEIANQAGTIANWENLNTLHAALNCAQWIVANSNRAMDTAIRIFHEDGERDSKRARADGGH